MDADTTDKTAEFFEAGLQHYGKALQAITEFKELLRAELQNALLTHSGSTLKLAADPEFTQTIGAPPSIYVSVFAPLSEGVMDPSAASREAGARIELGVWWTPPFASTTKVAAYTAVWAAGWKGRRIGKPPGFGGGFHKGKATNYLTCDLAKGSAVSAALQDLLRHLDNAHRILRETTTTA